MDLYIYSAKVLEENQGAWWGLLGGKKGWQWKYCVLNDVKSVFVSMAPGHSRGRVTAKLWSIH